MPVEKIRVFDIDFEPVITPDIIKKIMEGNDRELKAMLFEYLHHGTSRVRSGKEKNRRGR